MNRKLLHSSLNSLILLKAIHSDTLYKR